MAERIAIASVGLATAQGNASRILDPGAALASPAPLPWPPGTSTCVWCRPASAIPASLVGAARWNALARAALAECGGRADTPLVIGSCNGAAASLDADDWLAAFDTEALLDGTPWAGHSLPVASASCASGLHALLAARQRIDAGAGEVIVLAVDILSRANHTNFDVLRVLAPALDPPWQPGTRGFLPGEAAVALRITRAAPGMPAPGRPAPGMPLSGPILGHDLAAPDCLAGLIAGVPDPDRAAVVIGQGTGPAAVDSVELESLRRVDPRTPLTTPVVHFGHTLGASGLLSLALAALGDPLAALAMPARRGADGRRLATGDERLDDALIVCRALGGACAVAGTGRVAVGPRAPSFTRPCARFALHLPVLRQIAADAPAHRPHAPPERLIVRLDAPLLPPPRARIGDRLLPSAALEITPGALALVIARAWGFQGPATCWVGPGGRSDPTRAPPGPDGDPPPGTHVIYVEGRGQTRRVHWGT